MKNNLKEKIVNFGPLQFIRGKKGGRYPFCNSIFIKDAGIIIDPSSDRDRLIQLKNDIKAVWLSHWHEDHIMHLDLFKSVDLFMNALDMPPLQDVETFIDWYGVNKTNKPELIEGWKKMMVEHFNFEPRSDIKPLTDGQKIEVGEETVEVLHTPGHSPGNLSFFFVESKILFIGDYDLTPFGPWYGDRYSDIDGIIASVEKLKKKPAEVWLTGHEHGVFESEPGDAWDNYLHIIEKREQKLFDLLSEPKTIEEIGDSWIIYGKPIDPVAEFRFIEQLSMKKHADRLINQGMVGFSDNRYFRI